MAGDTCNTEGGTSYLELGLPISLYITSFKQDPILQKKLCKIYYYEQPSWAKLKDYFLFINQIFFAPKTETCQNSDAVRLNTFPDFSIHWCQPGTDPTQAKDHSKAPLIFPQKYRSVLVLHENGLKEYLKGKTISLQTAGNRMHQ